MPIIFFFFFLSDIMTVYPYLSIFLSLVYLHIFLFIYLSMFMYMCNYLSIYVSIHPPYLSSNPSHTWWRPRRWRERVSRRRRWRWRSWWRRRTRSPGTCWRVWCTPGRTSQGAGGSRQMTGRTGMAARMGRRGDVGGTEKAGRRGQETCNKNMALNEILGCRCTGHPYFTLA